MVGDVTVPAVADLVEGKRGVPVKPNELQAEGTLRVIELSEPHARSAELGDPDAI